ncbi:MAG: hypothetical protein L0338_26440 [Acidobacteria bacterium]|nr:hypothetical protein [Acidobacteriota bacterium]
MFHPSGKRLVCSGFDRTLRVWDLTGKEPVEVQSAIAHEDTVLRLAFSPDGSRLVTASWDKAIKVWDAARLELLQVLPRQPDWVLSLGFSPDGARLAAGRFDGSTSLYETSKFSVARDLVSPPFREQASLSQQTRIVE